MTIAFTHTDRHDEDGALILECPAFSMYYTPISAGARLACARRIAEESRHLRRIAAFADDVLRYERTATPMAVFRTLAAMAGTPEAQADADAIEAIAREALGI